MTEPHVASDHLQAEDVAGYLGGTLSTAMHERITRHLAECEECTAEAVAVHRLRPPAGSSARWVAAAAVAATLAGVALLGPGLLRRTIEGGPVLRGAQPGLAVSSVQPADGAVLRTPASFAWQRTPGATAYKVSVSRPDGDSVWAATTGDTTVRASPDLLRAGPGRYYWYVDALLDDGRSVTGPVHEFRLGP
jgi:hypothetical protein